MKKLFKPLKDGFDLMIILIFLFFSTTRAWTATIAFTTKKGGTPMK